MQNHHKGIGFFALLTSYQQKINMNEKTSDNNASGGLNLSTELNTAGVAGGKEEESHRSKRSKPSDSELAEHDNNNNNSKSTSSSSSSSSFSHDIASGVGGGLGTVTPGTDIQGEKGIAPYCVPGIFLSSTPIHFIHD
jgi:hypothetical protein